MAMRSMEHCSALLQHGWICRIRTVRCAGHKGHTANDSTSNDYADLWEQKKIRGHQENSGQLLLFSYSKFLSKMIFKSSRNRKL